MIKFTIKSPDILFLRKHPFTAFFLLAALCLTGCSIMLLTGFGLGDEFWETQRAIHAMSGTLTPGWDVPVFWGAWFLLAAFTCLLLAGLFTRVSPIVKGFRLTNLRLTVYDYLLPAAALLFWLPAMYAPVTADEAEFVFSFLKPGPLFPLIQLHNHPFSLFSSSVLYSAGIPSLIAIRVVPLLFAMMTLVLSQVISIHMRLTQSTRYLIQIMLILHPSFSAYATIGKGYVPAAFFFLVLLYGMLRMADGLKDGVTAFVWVAGILFTSWCGPFSFPFVIILVLAGSVFLFIRGRQIRSHDEWRFFMLSSVAGLSLTQLAFSVPFYFFSGNYFHDGTVGHFSHAGMFANALPVIADFFGSWISPFHALPGHAEVIAGGLLFVLPLIMLIRIEDANAFPRLVVAVFILVLSASVISGFEVPSRFFIPMVPGWALIMGYCLDTFSGEGKRVVMVAGAACLMLAGTGTRIAAFRDASSAQARLAEFRHAAEELHMQPDQPVWFHEWNDGPLLRWAADDALIPRYSADCPAGIHFFSGTPSQCISATGRRLWQRGRLSLWRVE